MIGGGASHYQPKRFRSVQSQQTVLASAGAIYDVRLPECCALPESDIRFWKVAKISYFLATFKVHPWIDLTFHEPAPQGIDCPGKLVQEPLYGS